MEKRSYRWLTIRAVIANTLWGKFVVTKVMDETSYMGIVVDVDRAAWRSFRNLIRSNPDPSRRCHFEQQRDEDSPPNHRVLLGIAEILSTPYGRLG